MSASNPPLRWIVSPRYDLTFFIGAAVLTLVFLGIYEGLKLMGMAPSGPAALFTYFLFTAVLDLPHIFQTFSRTHQDPVEFARRKHLYTWGLPLVMACGLLIPYFKLDAYFVAFMALYGSHHIIRQHVGFMKIYQGLNDAPNPLDRALDRGAFELGLYACVISDYVAEFAGQKTQDVAVYGKWHATFPAVPEVVVETLTQGAWLVVGLWLARQVYLALLGQRLNWPKLLLMTAAFTTHYTVFMLAAVPFLVAEAIETAYHDVQYHGWVSHYQRKRFPQIPNVAWKWLGAALAYGLVAGVVETIGFTNDLFYWVFAPLGMLTLFHYYIDGKIWRIRSNPELRSMVYGADEGVAAVAEPAAKAA